MAALIWSTMITILSSFLGSFLGFFFALLLFYITQHERTKLEKGSLANYLKMELEYNVTLIDEWREKIKQDLKFAERVKQYIFFRPRYDLFKIYFIEKAFKYGIIYDLLDNKHINSIAEILTFYTIDRMNRISSRIAYYKDKDIVDRDGEGVPTTGYDVIQLMLEDELRYNKDNQNNIKKIIPLIKYEKNALSNVVTKVVTFVQTRLKRYGL